MDTIIDKLLNHSDAKNLNNLNEFAILAKGLSAKIEMPAFEKRKRLFSLFEMILQTGKPKLAYHAIEGLQLMLRDSTFNSDSDGTRDDQRTVSQIIAHLSGLPNWDRQIQCQAITVLVQTFSSMNVKIYLIDVYAAILICSNTFIATEESSVKLAVRAALTQLLNSFCINKFSNTTPDSQEEILVFMDMITLIKELLIKIDNGQQTVADDLQLGLDALASVISVQPAHFYKHQPFLALFTTELIPSLLCLLQIAGEKKEKTKNFLGINRANSTKNQKSTIFSTSDLAKSFYQLVEHLLKLMAPLQTNRSLTIELFRASMVVPPPEKRYESLKLLKRFTTTPTLLSSLLNLMALDDSVWPIIVECVEESAKQTISSEVSIDAIKTLQIIFDTFDSIGAKFEQFHFDENFFDRIKTLNSEEKMKKECEVDEVDEDEKVNIVVETRILDSVTLFFEKLKKLVEKLLKMENPVEIDLKIQKFATKFAENLDEKNDAPLMNSDAVYLCIYASLSFCLKMKNGIKTKKHEFLSTVNCEGCIVYANDFWILALFEKLKIESLFEKKLCLDEKNILEGIIQDFDGSKKKLLIYQIFRSEIGDENSKPEILEERELKTKEMQELDFWMNRILSNCWGTIQIVLSKFPLKADKKTDKFLLEGAEATLEAIKSFSKILRHYSMKIEILWLFEKFGEEICNLEELREFIGSNPEKKPWTMTRVDALGIDLLLENVLISGTISPGCWKYVIRTVEYVADLERHQFNLIKTANTAYEGVTEGLKELLGQPNQKELNLKTIGKVLDELMLKIHRLFENAARQLNLKAFCSFLDFLIAANENNLKYSENKRIAETCSLIQRISKLVIDASNRPLIHLMKIWSIVYNHFSEATGARFSEEINRLAVISLGDSIRVLLRNETFGFCFHQALFQVFQNMLCSDSCAAETQEHVISILCSFIQDRPHQIGSGWKPLFGAVKAIRISNNRGKNDANHSRLSMVHFAVLEVLKKYFEINDPKVFVPTALEFFFCVSHYLQSTTQAKQNFDYDASSDEEQDAAIAETVFSFLLLSQNLLIDYFSSNEVLPSQNLINRLKLREKNMDFVEDNYDSGFADLPPLINWLREDSQLGVFPADLNEIFKRSMETFPWTKLNFSQQSITELVLTLIETLSGLVLTCPRQIQTKLISSLSEFISSFRTNEIGPNIGAFSLCSLIFPIFQKWSKQEKAVGFCLSPESAKSIRSLKQASGILTQVVVEFIQENPTAKWNERLLLDCFHLMNSFVAHPSQAISGIGTACLRHLIFSTAENYSEKLWTTTTISLWKANSITLAPIRRLCFHYFVDSTDFGGDIGEVAVGIRKEDGDRDHVELQIMAKQIFAIENANGVDPGNVRKSRTMASMDDSAPQTPSTPTPSSKQLAYVFKLTKAGSDPLSLSLEDVVTSLLNQQVLIQLINGILLGEQSTNLASGVSSTKKQETDSGFVGKAPTKAIGILLHCLDASAAVMIHFDERPALKMLIQRLCNLEQSANLYKFMIAAQSVKLMTVYQLAKNDKTHLKSLESSLCHLLEKLKKYDDEAAANKLSTFARDRLEQKIQISLVENNDKNPEFKSFSVVSASKCLEDYKKQKRMDSLPSKTNRQNPFVSKPEITEKQSSISPEKLQLSQLNDLDVRILAYSEIIAQTIERHTFDDKSSFDTLLPSICPCAVKFLRIATNFRARNCIADFLTRLAKQSKI